MIKGIFFDVGGTLCQVSNEANKKPSFKEILADFTGKKVTDFHVEKQPYLWTSAISKQELIIRLCQDLKIDNWQILYNKLATYSYNVSLFEDVINCLKQLKNKYRLGLLSNTTVWTAFDHNKLGVGNYIEVSILSCYVETAKPGIEIFKYAQKSVGLNFEELLYVGDSVKYDIKPALEAGWQAVLLCRDENTEKSPVPVISNLLELKNIIGE